MAKLTHEEFCRKAVTTLRSEGFKGINVQISGFNGAFKKYFETEEMQEVFDITRALAKEGKIALVPSKKVNSKTGKKSLMMYKPDDVVASGSADSVLDKMGV